jgi:amino acid efflux transporter
VGNNKTANAGLGLFRATGIYVCAILGSGVLILPAIAAREAGPASLLAWAALLVFSTPVAFSFAEMSRQEPDAGGIAHFVTRAFGRRASVVAGYLFYFAIPFGAPATAVIGGNYIANAAGGRGAATGGRIREQRRRNQALQPHPAGADGPARGASGARRCRGRVLCQG